MSTASELLDMSMEIQLEGRDLPNMDFGSLSDPFAVIDIRTKGEWVEFGTFAFRSGVCVALDLIILLRFKTYKIFDNLVPDFCCDCVCCIHLQVEPRLSGMC